MESWHTYWHSLPGEEKANTLTHLLPLIATLALVYPLLRLSIAYGGASPALTIVGVSLFLAGMILMFSSSTLYHAAMNPVNKARLRVFDHVAIYAMIAGSYSPICLTVIGGWVGWALFIFLWTCVVAGIVWKVKAVDRHPRLSLLLYLLMGWVALVVIVPIWRNISHIAFAWIIAEGLFYTIGSYFFHHDEQHAYFHAVWHVFIVLGAASHTIATWLILS